MAATTGSSTFEKKALPEKKPVLVLFNKVPKEGKPARFNGQESPRISMMLRVADNKYPDLVGYPLWYRVTPWVSGGEGQRESNLYKLIGEMLQGPVPAAMIRTDARDWSEDEWRALFGYYVVRMGAPDYGEDGALRWQDIEDILNPEGIDFPTESRKADLQTGRQTAGPIGLPKAKNPPPTPTPPQEERAPAPAPEPPKHLSSEFEGLTTEQHRDKIRGLLDRKGAYSTTAKGYLLKKGAERVSALNEDDTKHLHALLLIVEHSFRNEHMNGLVVSHLETRKCQVHQLEPADSLLLLLALNKALADGVKF